MRGVLTDEIQRKAVDFLKREITQRELRLYPFIDYSIKNACHGWSYDKMELDDIAILNKLDGEGNICYSPEGVLVSREFYDFIQDVLAISYVEKFI